MRAMIPLVKSWKVGAVERIFRQLPFADCRKPIDPTTEIDRLTSEQNPELRNQLNH